MSNRSNENSVKQKTAEFAINAFVVMAALIATTYELVRSTEMAPGQYASTTLHHSKTDESSISERCQATTESESIFPGNSAGDITKSRNSGVSGMQRKESATSPTRRFTDESADQLHGIKSLYAQSRKHSQDSPMWDVPLSMDTNRRDNQFHEAPLGRRRVVGSLEQEIIDLRDVVSHLQTANKELTTNLHRARKLIESLEINHFPGCPLLESPIADSRETPCGHIICRGCISKWLEKNDTCPCCSESLRYGQLETVGRCASRGGIAPLSLQRQSSSEWLSVRSGQGIRIERGPIEWAYSGLEMKRSRRRQLREDDLPREFLDFYRSLDDDDDEC